MIKFESISEQEYKNIKNLSEILLFNTARSEEVLNEYIRRKNLPNDKWGLYTLDSPALITNGWGYVINNELSLSDIGGSGWNPLHLEKIKNENENLIKNFQSYLDSKSIDSIESAIMLTFPGAYTYGHWLVDIRFRIHLVQNLMRYSYYNDSFFLLGGPPTPWMLEFLEIFEIDLSKVIWIRENSLYKINRLYIPTICSHNNHGILNTKLISKIYKKNAYISDKTILRKEKKIVFFVHKNITSVTHRTWSNQYSVMNRLEEIGVIILDPMSCSIKDTITLISDATLIIGQDSSALHNCLFTNADCIVVETDKRSNMIHCSIQDSINCKISYLNCILSEDGDYVLSENDIVKIITICASINI